ncbi:PPR4 [Symbiodinium microadriaticum]|nr:PPR4 [Symbiodinium microadriaticum]CAE7945076.1 PPR4 [Symbiodinium sp. KB8]
MCRPLPGHAHARALSHPAVLWRGLRYLWFHLLLLALIYLRLPPETCGLGKQGPLRLLRQQAGLELRTKINNPNMSFSPEARRLIPQIANARERGDWRKVGNLFESYTGNELPVLHAVLHAAYSCGQYRAGAKIYDKICDLNITQDAASFGTAMKVFAKLSEPQRVGEIWAQARRSCDLDELLAAARIDAAAAFGDIETAAGILDEMNRSGVSINIAHVTSAIRACWESNRSSHHAAGFLFNWALEMDLQPNVVTFTCLMGAFARAPLAKVLQAHETMRQLEVKANKAFAEVYLNTLLQITKEEWQGLNSIKEMAQRLSCRTLARRQAAQKALEEFSIDGVAVTTLSSNIEQALKRLPADS